MSKLLKTEASLVRAEPTVITVEVSYDAAASIARSVRPAMWKIVKKHGTSGTWSGPHVLTSAQIDPGPTLPGKEWHMVAEYRKVPEFRKVGAS